MRERFIKDRLMVYVSIYISYVVYSIGRRGFLYALPWIVKDIGLSMPEIGFAIGAMSLFYGLGRIFHGAIADKYNAARPMISTGLALAGIINIIFGYASSYFTIAIMCGASGFAQSMGFPPCSRVLSNWFTLEERGKYWSIWSTSYALGEAITPWIIEYATRGDGGWRSGLFLIANICFAIALYAFFATKDSPQDSGYAPINKRSKDKISDKGYSIKRVFTFVFSDRKILYLSVACFLVQFIRSALGDWMMIYVSSLKNNTTDAVVCVSLFGLGGILGMPIWGYLSDISFNKFNSRIPVVIFSLLILILDLVMWDKLIDSSSFVYAILSFIAGCAIFGPQMLNEIIAIDILGSKVAGTSTGIIGMISYIGSALSGILVGLLISIFNWNIYFIFLLIISIMVIVIYSLLFKLFKNG